jgi:DNA polymerase
LFAVLNAATYPDFRKQMRESGCTRCALAEHRTHIVVDRGNPDARVLAIGEAPGAQEDRTGMAFCGRAGKMLDDLFAAEGLSTDEHLLIVNVVKCRPPGNRAPQRDEAARCRPFLERQLALSPAWVVALMGTTALRHFAPERARGRLAEQVGRFFQLPEWPGREFVVLYHPAAILYNRSLEPVAREHVRALAARVRNDGLPADVRPGG